MQADPARAARDAPVLVVGTHSVHVRRFVAGLCKAQQPVVVITDAAPALVDHPLVLEQARADFSVTSLATPGVIRRSIRRWQPRVVHVHQANSVAWHAVRAAADGGTPVVLTIWGSDVLLTPAQGLLKRHMVRAALRGADAWTADAAELLRAARAVAGAERPSALIPLGVERIEDALDAVWPEKQDVVLSCRLHKPLYRIDDVIRAFGAIAARAPSWRLEVAASGSETDALERLAAALGLVDRVTFVGMLASTALHERLRRARVVVSFPVSDGTSVSLLEAMANGCVPVVSDLPANREWIVDGLNGVVAATPDDLSQAIESAMQISGTKRWSEQLAPASLQLVRDKARFADNVLQFLALYARLGR